MGMNFGVNWCWVNFSKSGVFIRVSVLRLFDEVGLVIDLFECCYKQGKISGIKNVKELWWCVVLSEKYLLYFIYYILRYGLGNGGLFFCNWQFEGLFDGFIWEVLKKYYNDSKLCEFFLYIVIWLIEGEVGVYRFF